LPGSARTPLVRVAVRGWIGANTEMSLAWLDGVEPALADVVRLMVTVLVAALGAAGVDPAVLDALAAEARLAITRIAP
jgi:hypothetical protein